MTSAGIRWLAATLSILAGLFILLLALGAHVGLLDARKLVAEGRQAEGTVTHKAVGGKRSSRRDFTYAFAVGSSQFTRTATGIGYDDHSQMQIGQKVPVWYDPRNPEKNVTRAELNDLEAWPNRLFFPLIGAALLGWGVARIVRRKRA